MIDFDQLKKECDWFIELNTNPGDITHAEVVRREAAKWITEKIKYIYKKLDSLENEIIEGHLSGEGEEL